MGYNAIKRDVAQLGSAPRSGRGSRRFKSCHPDLFNYCILFYIHLEKKYTKQPFIGEIIRELRKELQLTQEEFANSLGVVFPTVNRWENGHNNPSKMAIKLIEEQIKNLGQKGQDLLKNY